MDCGMEHGDTWDSKSLQLSDLCGARGADMILGYPIVCGLRPGHDGDHVWRGPQDAVARWHEIDGGVHVTQMTGQV